MDRRPLLEELDAGEGDPTAGLAFLASQEVAIPEDELVGPMRRALLLVAAGGDPHRELELSGRPISSLAADLDAPERRRALTTALERLRADSSGLPNLERALERLLEAPEVAWRWFASALLADELTPEQ